MKSICQPAGFLQSLQMCNILKYSPSRRKINLKEISKDIAEHLDNLSVTMATGIRFDPDVYNVAMDTNSEGERTI